MITLMQDPYRLPHWQVLVVRMPSNEQQCRWQYIKIERPDIQVVLLRRQRHFNGRAAKAMRHI